MVDSPGSVERQVSLRLSGAADGADLSTVCRDDRLLWLAADEKPRILCLTAADDGRSYTDPARFDLGELLDLPDGPKEEVDVQGIDVRDGYVWVVGSHSRTRKKVRGDEDPEEAVTRLGTVEPHPNRDVILRLPLAGKGEDRHPVPSDGNSKRPAVVYVGLRDALAEDAHLSRFLTIPSKDNGLDVEGITVLENGLLLGLRGPVLRGWAVVLEVTLDESAARIARYRKFFLNLGGLGIRDLCRVGDDVLVLTGPTMALDGPARLHRWPNAARARDRSVLTADRLPILSPVPYGTGKDAGCDHPEGVTALPGDGTPEVLVVYDTPGDSRLSRDKKTVQADIIKLRGMDGTA